MGLTAYGRGRSRAGKIHLADTKHTTAFGLTSMQSVSSPYADVIVDCQRCRKILAKRELLISKLQNPTES